MKKNRYLISLFLSILLLSGCNSWLDLEPTNKVDDKKLFSTYEGFRVSLNGIYQSISSGQLYGREMTWGAASVIGQDYLGGQIGTSSIYTYVQTYEYDRSSTQTIIKNIWSTAYNAIANCNILIREIENKDGDFFPEGIGEKNLILGEALALRGMLHFDMLRLFAPAPSTQDNGAYIPYYTKFPSYYSAKLPTTEVLENVILDLERARDLVMQWDTTADNRPYLYAIARRFPTSYIYIPDTGEFFSSRGSRLNFAAIYGLLARVCLYAGRIEEAKEYAYYIYNTLGPEGTNSWGSTKWFTFTPTNKIGATTPTNNHIKLYEDILFSLYDDQLLVKIDDYKKLSSSLASKSYMRLNSEVFDFDSWDDADDARSMLIVKDEADYDVSQRWMNTGATGATITNQYKMLPVIRLSEIYYILSECLYLEGNTVEAENILNQVRNARGAKRQVTGSSPEKFREELLWEYRKEFMTEGQTFFAYKRLNEPAIKIGSQSIEMRTNYIFPLPDNEEIY
ncbi:MAG: RagB/SusD family nutrient uptake outer membrane protein [Bacteroidales bacterium]|nr:RagB/SusD family nutrient uptake outer membrane protein [Bacteroidales bacterium]MDD3990127.1 RagB/SusD family nutrient uptake outer membrane protein [Bacteroidales bacterium]